MASVPPMGRDDLDCATKVAAIERVAQSVSGPIVIVAHSGGCIMVAHWAKATKRAVHGALLAAPPDFEQPMPEGYPTLEAIRAGGWLPVPRVRLPFRSIVGASRNDPLGELRPRRRPGEGLGQRTRRPRRGRPPEPGLRLRRVAACRRVHRALDRCLCPRLERRTLRRRSNVQSHSLV